MSVIDITDTRPLETLYRQELAHWRRRLLFASGPTERRHARGMAQLWLATLQDHLNTEGGE